MPHTTQYRLPGSRAYQERLYPNPALLLPSLGLTTFEQVIAHFTASSLAQDGIGIEPGSLSVTAGADGSGFIVAFKPAAGFEAQAEAFAAMHVAFLGAERAGLRWPVPMPANRPRRGTRWRATR